MARPFLVLTISLLIVIEVGAAASEPISPSLGPIALDMTRAEVERALGRPRRTIRTGDLLDPELRFPGIVVWLYGDTGRVGSVRSTDRRYCTMSGVCPGALAESASQALGPRDGGHELGEGDNDYPVASETCWLRVHVTEGVVKTLEILCQP